MPKLIPGALNATRAMSGKTFRETKYECSRASYNKYIRSGELKSFLDGAKRMILESDADDFIERKAARGGTVPPEIHATKVAAGRKGKAAQIASRRESEPA